MLLSLIENLDKLDIILASASPRRFEILKNAGLTFRVLTSPVEEDNTLQLSPAELALYHAMIKGRDIAAQHPQTLVISADTIVVCDGEIMGKPVDEEDAFRMLSKLSGKTHQVITGFGVRFEKYNQSVYDTVQTEVTFRTLNEEEILAYIDTAEPFDKAGAYAVQGQGSILIEKINGCFFNVVGFPLSRFYIVLDKFLKEFVF